MKLLKEHPEITVLRLEGHCDHRASEKHNEALSWRRAYAVRNYLLNKGITVELQARGYGETERVDTTETEAGMQKNRRVELHIVK